MSKKESSPKREKGGNIGKSFKSEKDAYLKFEKEANKHLVLKGV